MHSSQGNVYQYIWNKPETYATGGKSVMMARSVVLLLFSQKLPSHPRKQTLFLSLFALSCIVFCLDCITLALLHINNGK